MLVVVLVVTVMMVLLVVVALDGYFHQMKELCQSIWSKKNNSEEFFL